MSAVEPLQQATIPSPTPWASVYWVSDAEINFYTVYWKQTGLNLFYAILWRNQIQISTQKLLYKLSDYKTGNGFGILQLL